MKDLWMALWNPRTEASFSRKKLSDVALPTAENSETTSLQPLRMQGPSSAGDLCPRHLLLQASIGRKSFKNTGSCGKVPLFVGLLRWTLVLSLGFEVGSFSSGFGGFGK